MPNNPIEPEQFPDVERDDWSAETISEEASNESSDDTVRRMLRGDETDGDPNKRDIAGGVESAETPQGSEEAKIDTQGNS